MIKFNNNIEKLEKSFDNAFKNVISKIKDENNETKVMKLFETYLAESLKYYGEVLSTSNKENQHPIYLRLHL